jgi:hypothetical protein
MAVAVQADAFDLPRSLETSLHAGERLLGDGLPCLQQVGGHEALLQQISARLVPKGFDA